MGRWTIVNAVLALMVALLGFEIARTWAHRLPAIEVPPSPMPPPDGPGLEGHEKGKRGVGDKNAARMQQTPAVMVAAIADKDLFDPSRRPPTPDEVKVDVAPPVTKPPEGVTIVGVRIFGKDREVFMNDATQAPATGRRLRLGDQIAGFTVKAIEPAGVVLTSPSGDSVTMPLTLDKSKGQPAQPGGPRPPAVRPAPRPGQPAAAAAAASPAAGPQGASTAAGVAVKSPTQPQATARPVVPPPQPGQAQPAQQLPSQVLQKLEQLRQNDKRPGRRR
jgi:hypothetical protein